MNLTMSTECRESLAMTMWLARAIRGYKWPEAEEAPPDPMIGLIRL